VFLRGSGEPFTEKPFKGLFFDNKQSGGGTRPDVPAGAGYPDFKIAWYLSGRTT